MQTSSVATAEAPQVNTSALDFAAPDQISWTRSIQAELNFWRDQFAGPTAPLEHNRERIQRNTRRLLPSDARGKRVLDLGSGPFPLVGDDIDVVAADPLADQYQEMLRRVGFAVPSKFLPAAGETLEAAVDSGSFDYVIASACLDQCYDPVAFIAGCRFACRPGGTIVIRCQNLWDPTNMKRGARIWNSILCDDDLIIWRPGHAFSIRSLVGPVSHFKIEDHRDGGVTVRSIKATAKKVESPDYAAVYDALYSEAHVYTASHTSPGLRTALRLNDRILAAGPCHLDVGAGPGYLVEVLSMPPFRKQSHGVDVSAVAVALANKRLKSDLVKVMRPGEIPHPDKCFDLLTCFDVLEHLEIEDVRKLMSEIRRVARPGGIGLFNISLRDSSLRDINGDSVHRSLLSPSDWDALIEFNSYHVDKKECELLGELIF